MEEKIRKHIDGLFAGAPKTRKAMDLKEEMTQNTIEKYQDLIGEGYQEEDAWQMVTASIGDVTELFHELEEPDLFLSEEDRRKKAILKAAAIGLYILAGVVLFAWMIISESYFYSAPDLGMFGMIAAHLPVGVRCQYVPGLWQKGEEHGGVLPGGTQGQKPGKGPQGFHQRHHMAGNPDCIFYRQLCDTGMGSDLDRFSDGRMCPGCGFQPEVRE